MNINEKELVAACLRGEQLAQKQFYEHFKVRMYHLCLRYASSREEAEDWLLEGFFKVFKDLKQYQFKAPLGAWVRQVLINHALMQIRKRHRQDFVQPFANWEAIEPMEDASIEFELLAKEVLEALQKLPDGFRTIFNMYAIDGYSHEEIGKQLHISAGTSRSQYARAKKALMNQLIQQKVL